MMPTLVHLIILSAVFTSPQPGYPLVADTPGVAPAMASVPFGPGELSTYEVRFGAVRVGSGTMEVAGIERVRGMRAWRTVFTVQGGTVFYKVNDRMESWMDVRDLSSLRFIQDLDEGGRERERHFEIYPDRAVFTENGGDEQPSVSNPLDDASFLFFVRTVPLEVGQSYTFHRYFRPDRNPVTIHVVRRERVRVPAGTFDAVVIRPVIKTRGIFSERGQAEIWLTDDDRRIMVQMKSRLSFGSLNLYLRSYRPPNNPR